MASGVRKLVVLGQGAAGLAAAVSAAEQARGRATCVEITLLEKAREDEAGGNSRFSPSYMRMAAPDRLEPSFEDDIQDACAGMADPGYFRALAENAVETIAWLVAQQVEFTVPTYYLSAGPPRIQPVGGGRAIVEKLLVAAKRAGVTMRHGCPAARLVTKDGSIAGVEARPGNSGAPITFDADAVIIATGGFQGDAGTMCRHFGPHAQTLKLISPGTRFDTGDGIRMAADLGASVAGDWNGMHIEPVDPRSQGSAPVVLVYPYGIVVDRNGHRFVDEGRGLVHQTWEVLARDIHFGRPNSIAYAVLDSRLFDIAGVERAIRSEVRPYQAATIEGLAALISVPSRTLRETVSTFNAAATGDAARFDATRCDGLAAASELEPPKSNWARAIDRPPFLAYPLVGAVAYTFGGIATNAKAEVLSGHGVVRGLYAAGETTGHFHRTAPNAVAMLRALVFGRIAGRQAIEFLQGS